VTEEQPEPGAPTGSASEPARAVPPASEARAASPASTASPSPAAPVQVQLRRAPRYRAFVATGAVLGVVAGVLVTLVLAGGDSIFSTGTVVGYLGAIGLLLGALAGAGAAVLADRPRR
jgi:hypothetical protein